MRRHRMIPRLGALTALCVLTFVGSSTAAHAPRRERPPRAELARIGADLAMPPAAPGSAGGAVATIAVDSGDGGIDTGFGSVWIANFGANDVQRIDPATDAVIATIPVDPEPGGLRAGDGAVWVTNADSNELSKISPATNTVVDRVPVGKLPEGVALTRGSVWVASHHGDPTGSVYRIDAATDQVVARIPVGSVDPCCGPQNIDASGGSVWVGVPNVGDSGAVVRIDVTSDRIEATIPVENGACGDIAASATAVFASGGGCDFRTEVVDPTTNTVSATLEPGPYVVGLRLGPGRLLYTRLNAGATVFGLGEIAPESHRVGPTTPLPFAPGEIATGFGSVWVANIDGSGMIGRVPDA
jgi:YVTN family beta-propeller protein